MVEMILAAIMVALKIVAQHFVALKIVALQVVVFTLLWFQPLVHPLLKADFKGCMEVFIDIIHLEKIEK